jgi:hypothetical protein
MLQKVGPHLYYEFWREFWYRTGPSGKGCRLTVVHDSDTSGYLLGEARRIAAAVGMTSPVTLIESPNLYYGGDSATCTLARCIEALQRAVPELELTKFVSYRGVDLLSTNRLVRVHASNDSRSSRVGFYWMIDDLKTTDAFRRALSLVPAPTLRAAVTATERVNDEIYKEAAKIVGKEIAKLTKGVQPYIDIDSIAHALRKEPENHRKLAESRDKFVVIYQVDRSYTKIDLSMYFLEAYDAASQQYRARRRLAVMSQADVRRNPVHRTREY